MGVILSGCVTALRPANQPSQQKLRVEASTPQEYMIRVAEKTDYTVPADGRVIVDVPHLERGCAMYLFGAVKVKDHSPYDVPAIHIKRGNHTIRKLSLNDLAKLPVDDEGYRLVKLK